MIFLWLPINFGSTCSYVLGSFWTAETCKPPLWENADAPTYGKFLLGFLFKISSSNLEHSVNVDSLFLFIFRSYLSLKVFLRESVGITDIKFAFPHLSPSPLIVPCTCLTPACIAVSEFATAFSVSLCAWIPKFLPGITFVTLETISPTSCGRVPPLVSHKTNHLAPWSKACLRQSKA